MDSSTPFSPSPAQAEVIFAEVTLGSATLTDLAMRFNLPLCGLSDWFNSAVTVAQRQCVQTAHASAVRLAASTALCASLTRVCRRAIRPELEPPDPKDPTGARRDIRLLEILYKLCRFVPVSAAPPSDDFPKPRPPSPTSPFTPNTPPPPPPAPESGPRPAPSAPSAPSVKSAVAQAIRAISAISANSAPSPLSQSPTPPPAPAFSTSPGMVPLPPLAPPLAQAASPSPAPAAASESLHNQRDALQTIVEPAATAAPTPFAPAGATQSPPRDPTPTSRASHAAHLANLVQRAGSLTPAAISIAATPNTPTAHAHLQTRNSPRPASHAPS